MFPPYFIRSLTTRRNFYFGVACSTRLVSTRFVLPRCFCPELPQSVNDVLSEYRFISNFLAGFAAASRFLHAVVVSSFCSYLSVPWYISKLKIKFNRPPIGCFERQGYEWPTFVRGNFATVSLYPSSKLVLLTAEPILGAFIYF